MCKHSLQILLANRLSYAGGTCLLGKPVVGRHDAGVFEFQYSGFHPDNRYAQ